MAKIIRIVKKASGTVEFQSAARTEASLVENVDIVPIRRRTALRIVDINKTAVEVTAADITELEIEPASPVAFSGDVTALWQELTNDFFSEAPAAHTGIVADFSAFAGANLTTTLNVIFAALSGGAGGVSVAAFGQRLDAVSTTLTTPQDYLVINTPSLSPGTYAALAFAELDVSLLNRSAAARVYNETDTAELFRKIQEKKDRRDVLNFSGFQFETFAGEGSKQYKVQYWRAGAGGGNTATIRNAAFLLLKIA